jgi:hypothetical protein
MEAIVVDSPDKLARYNGSLDHVISTIAAIQRRRLRDALDRFRGIQRPVDRPPTVVARHLTCYVSEGHGGSISDSAHRGQSFTFARSS